MIIVIITNIYWVFNISLAVCWALKHYEVIFLSQFYKWRFFSFCLRMSFKKKKYIMSSIMSAYRQLIFLPASVSYIRLPSWYLLLEVPEDLTPSLPGFPIKGNGTHLSSHPWHILFPNSPLIYLIHHLFPLCFCMFLHFIFPIHLIFPSIFSQLPIPNCSLNSHCVNLYSSWSMHISQNDFF